jgi:hypothetical protein
MGTRGQNSFTSILTNGSNKKRAEEYIIEQYINKMKSKLMLNANVKKGAGLTLSIPLAPEVKILFRPFYRMGAIKKELKEYILYQIQPV